MFIEGIKCDIVDVLQNDNRDVLHNWTSSCREFRSRVSAYIEKTLLYRKDCNNKKSINTEKITELQQKIDRIKSNIDAIGLQQKVVDKKIANTVKLQENLQNELDETKNRREVLLMEIVDLQLDIEQRKNKKFSKWDAIKRACNIYKTYLDIHITLQKEHNCQDNIKFSFFTNNEAINDEFFVQLSCIDNQWEIEQIQPRLKTKHLNQLNLIKGISEKFEVLDVTLFLYEIRNTYLNHYMKTRAIE